MEALYLVDGTQIRRIFKIELYFKHYTQEVSRWLTNCNIQDTYVPMYVYVRHRPLLRTNVLK